MITLRAQKMEMIRSRLSRFIYNLKLSNKQHLTDMNSEAEDLFCPILNILWFTNLVNINKEIPNAEAVDLYDVKLNLYVQVSSDGSKKKVESALNGCSRLYPHSHFRFLHLNIETKRIPSGFKIPDGMSFDPEKDFYDVGRLIREIDCLDAEHFDEMYDFIERELAMDDMGKVTSSLGIIVRILAQEPMIDNDKLSLVTPSVQDKIEINDLVDMQGEIEDWSIKCGYLDQVLFQFSSTEIVAVQHRVKRSYIQCRKNGKLGSDLFFAIVDDLRNYVISNGDLRGLTSEVIENGICIVVTDVFMKCIIFEKTKKVEEINGSAR